MIARLGIGPMIQFWFKGSARFLDALIEYIGPSIFVPSFVWNGL